eukprot:XP_001695922.1 predicted protein [Chlamydomonas reinhardtii]
MAKLTVFLSDMVLAGLKRQFRPPSSGNESRGANQGFRRRLMVSYGMTPNVIRRVARNHGRHRPQCPQSRCSLTGSWLPNPAACLPAMLPFRSTTCSQCGAWCWTRSFQTAS